MKKYQIRIELLSDLCVSDGSTYNSMIDTDICKDRYGFPYIPARRIRGCLRECAKELNDWGCSIPIEKLFGTGGGPWHRSALRLGNAYLDGYQEKLGTVKKHQGHVIVHPQNILNHFSYIRKQTSIDNESGVALDGSLRSMRVANKGLVFCSDAEAEEEYAESLSCCCAVFRHMGMARTRGLGEVKVALEETGQAACIPAPGLKEDSTVLYYQIDLIEPMICKETSGGEAVTQDYIEGSKILGLILERLKKSGQEPGKFLDNGWLICSNAYIMKEGERYTEVPGYLYSIKNDGKRYVNQLYGYGHSERKAETESLQLEQMKHCYVLERSGLKKADVLTEERYHHRRPDDKSIGRASATDGEAGLYQMASISEGQSFSGFIHGSIQQICTVYGLLSENETGFLGYARSSEYGKIRVSILKAGEKHIDLFEDVSDLCVTLKSPAIIYSQKAMASINLNDLQEEILSALGISRMPSDTVPYLRYTTAGGYQATWNRRKPTLPAFDKGTAVHFHFDPPISFRAENLFCIGERTAEGYGEADVKMIDMETGPYIGEIAGGHEELREEILNINGDGFLSELCHDLMLSFARVDAVKAAREKARNGGMGMRPTISNMSIMVKEQKNLDDIGNVIRIRYEKASDNKQEKKRIAEEILDIVRKRTEKLPEDFARRYAVRGYTIDRNELQMSYLRSYLTHAKYILRENKEEGCE